MAKIIMAIMLIFIASTHCALRDCSKEQLVQIAVEANAAYKEALGLPAIGLPYFGGYEINELISEIRRFAKEGGNTVQKVIKNLLLSFKKLHAYPVYEVVSTLPRNDLHELCRRVNEFARNSQVTPFMGGLTDNITEYTPVERIIEALQSFVQSWNVSVEKVMEIAFEINSAALYEAVSEKLNINFLKALALGVEKMHNHVRGLFLLGGLHDYIDSLTPRKIIEQISTFLGNLIEVRPELLEALTDIICWEIIANSENLSGQELVNELTVQLSLS